MRGALLSCIAVLIVGGNGHAAEWRLHNINAPARVTAVEMVGAAAHVNAGGLWYRVDVASAQVRLAYIDAPPKPELPQGSLPDGHVATGTRDIARAWLANPTTRYDHGVLGDAIEAGSLVIESHDGSKRYIVRLPADAVFEDLKPRIADLDGDSRDEIVLVKTYLKRGASLVVVAERNGKYDIIAETPPLGAPHRWLNPAGIADFNGDSRIDIALVRQPHVVGSLELWTWADKTLRKVADVADATNHIIGASAIDMTAAADFDGDGVMDLAVPSLDRSRLRIIAFAPEVREIASVALPAKAVTNIGLVAADSGPPSIVAGLADGSLVVVRRVQ